jgi:hypothetical protein
MRVTVQYESGAPFRAHFVSANFDPTPYSGSDFASSYTVGGGGERGGALARLLQRHEGKIPSRKRMQMIFVAGGG